MAGIAKQGNQKRDLRPWYDRVNKARNDGGRGLQNGYRSGLEEANGKLLESLGVPVLFEVEKIKYEIPASSHTYTPDFKLPNGFFIETKGKFEHADRMKHLLVKAQHPDVEIRFVFSRPNDRLRKGSGTTYAMWCEKHGFKFAARLIPVAWIKEKPSNRKVVISIIE